MRVEDISSEVEDDYCCKKARLAATLRGSQGNSFCYGCKTVYCEKCWDKQTAHSKKKKKPGHEKIDLLIARLIQETLDEDPDDDEQAMRHVFDDFTAWFGAGKDQQGSTVFRDFGRFASLMAERTSKDRKRCYPALVPLVGEDARWSAFEWIENTDPCGWMQQECRYTHLWRCPPLQRPYGCKIQEAISRRSRAG